MFSRRLGGSAGGFGFVGETAHSRLNLGSPRRGDPTLGLSIRADSSFAGLSETAEDCRCYNSSSSWLCGFV